jgi:hypothetical protein
LAAVDEPLAVVGAWPAAAAWLVADLAFGEIAVAVFELPVTTGANAEMLLICMMFVLCSSKRTRRDRCRHRDPDL